MQTNTSKIGLVLSGGGAKGAYQVGVVRFLVEAGMQIQAVSGASIGALNGAIIANAQNLNEASEQLEHLWQLLANESPLKLNTSSIIPYLGFAMLMGAERLSPVAMATKKAYEQIKDSGVFEGYLDGFETSMLL